jgi:hypothetical protein
VIVVINRLRMPEGIVVYLEDVPNPARLPILGLRARVRSAPKSSSTASGVRSPGWFQAS